MTWPARTRRLAAMAVLALAAGGAGEAPVKVFLEAVDEDAVKGPRAGQGRSGAAQKLTRTEARRAGCEPAGRDGGAARDRVPRLDREAADQRGAGAAGEHADPRAGHRGRDGGRLRARGRSANRSVLLVVRATWGDHFQDLQSYDKDHSLKDAVDSVAGQMDALARRGLRPRAALIQSPGRALVAPHARGARMRPTIHSKGGSPCEGRWP